MADGLKQDLCDLIDRPIAIDEDDPLWLAPSEIMESLPNAFVEARAHAFVTTGTAVTQTPAHPDMRLQVEDKCQIRLHRSQDLLVQAIDLPQRDSAGEALIHAGRVHEAI